MLKEYLICVLVLLAAVLVIGLLVNGCKVLSTRALYRAFGMVGLAIATYIGVFVHETGHLLTAIITFAKVKEVKLFPRIKEIRAGGQLGYVSYTTRRNFWGRFSGLLIASAPLFFGSVVILLLLRLLSPNVFFAIAEALKQAALVQDFQLISFLQAAAKAALEALSTGETWTNPWFYLFLLLAGSVAAHMSLSVADVKILLKGSPYLLVLLALLGLFVYLGLFQWLFLRKCFYIGTAVLILLLAVALIFAVLNMLICSLLAAFRRRK